MEKKIIDLHIKQILRHSKLNKVNLLRWIKNFHKILIIRLLQYIKKTKSLTVKTFWGGKMEVIIPEVVSTAIWRNKYFDENVSIYLLKFLKEGNVMLDVGAHFGFYSLLASYLVGKEGKIISFEPSLSTYRQLEKNIINFSSFNNIEAFNLAVYSKNIFLEFKDFGIVHSAFNTLGKVRNTENIKANSYRIEAVCLDEFLQSRYPNLKIDLVKIDAESVELNILNGFTRTLIYQSPKLIIEVGDLNEDSSNSRMIIEFLSKLNYSPFEFKNGGIVKHLPLVKYDYNNLLFIKNN